MSEEGAPLISTAQKANEAPPIICLGFSKRGLFGVIAGVLVLAGIVGLVTALYFVNNKTTEEPEAEWDQFRLPSFVTPTHYDVELDVDVVNWVYNIKETIHINITVQNITSIALHVDATYVTITSATLVNDQGETLTSKNTSFVPEMQLARFQFGSVMKDWLKRSSQFKLNIQANGTISDGGFYSSNYMENGVQQTVAVTDLEPNAARGVFPCFDEPQMKATFNVNISLDTSTGFKPLTNMPILSENPVSADDVSMKFQFQKTPLMSTYLFCLVISQYSYISMQGPHGITLSVWAPPSRVEQGRFALNTSNNALEIFESFFGIDYPLPKVDLVAIPNFASIGMENWGLSTFSMEMLLWDPDVSTVNARQHIAKTVTHEMCHQWVGDLVTLEWWSDLWLNEGFTEYFEYFGVDRMYPDWKIFDQFLFLERGVAMNADAVSATHTLVTVVDGPNAVLQLFDPITYSKGASLVLMIKEEMEATDPGSFQTAMHKYLDRYKFSNANTTGLLDMFVNSSGNTEVENLVKSWSSQSGYPMVMLQQAQGSDYVTILQNKVDDNGNRTEQLWRIPMTLQLEDGSVQKFTFDTRTTEAPFKNVLLGNVNGHGYYRVVYDDVMHDRIANILKNNMSQISPGTRASIIDDAFNMNFDKISSINMNYTMALLEYINQEDSLVPWLFASKAFDRLYTLVDGQTMDLLQEFVKNKTSALVEKMTWIPSPSDSHSDVMLRGLVYQLALDSGNTAVINKAYSYFTLSKSSNILPPFVSTELWPVVLNSAGIFNNTDDYNWIYNRWKRSIIPTEREDLLASLCTFSDPVLMNRTLYIAINSNTTSLDAVVILKSMVLHSDVSRRAAWEFLKHNWVALTQQDSGSAFLMADILTVPSTLSTTADYEDVSQFLAAHPIVSAQEASAQAEQLIIANVDWRIDNEQTLLRWLQQWSEKVTSK